MQLRGQRRGGRQHLWPPVGGAVLLPETPPGGQDAGGVSGSSGSGTEHPSPPVCMGFHRRAPKPPGLRRFSQNPAFTLPASELLLALFFLSQSVVPKIVNPRNHREADTDANTRGFINKLELGSKYTPHSRAGTWTPKWVIFYRLV